MYVSLNKETMQIVHKYYLMHIVTDLVHIELPMAPVDICPEEAVANHKTDAELKLLFRSCFPGEGDHIAAGEMKARIVQFAKDMPETDVDPVEVQRQSRSISPTDGKPYQYVKGSFRPSRDIPLFNGFHGSVRAAQARQGPTPGTLADGCLVVDFAPSQQAFSARSVQSFSRAKGAKETIWALADDLWKASGSPTDKAQVLALRKIIMFQLEEYGVKRTTSSNELGNWQKARIS